MIDNDPETSPRIERKHFAFFPKIMDDGTKIWWESYYQIYTAWIAPPHTLMWIEWGLPYQKKDTWKD